MLKFQLGDLEQEILSGLETWFTCQGEETLVPPPKYKMMCIVWLSIFPLSLSLNYCLKPVISELTSYWAVSHYFTDIGHSHDICRNAAHGKTFSSLATLH